MSTPQEYWDACLIKTWRNMGTYRDAQKMFYSIMKQWPEKIEPPLLRHPVGFLPNGMQIRYFMSTWLPKMNDWLWSHPPDKDVELLRAVTKSRYTVLEKSLKTEEDKERKALSVEKRKSHATMKLDRELWETRNKDTDWGVTKAPGKYRTRRLK